MIWKCAYVTESANWLYPSMTLNLISDKIVMISLYMKEGV